MCQTWEANCDTSPTPQRSRRDNKSCVASGTVSGLFGHANWNRTAFAAAHVVTNPLATYSPTLDSAIDWDATLAYRSHLWRHGFGVAEAMDTAQRGAGLTWPDALKLIRETARWAKAEGCPVASGAGTDHLDPGKPWRMEDIIDAYRFQCEAIEQAGSRVILMSSRALAANAKSAEDYFRVYHEVLRSLEHPAILHWLGSAFDPALSGYWGQTTRPKQQNIASLS